ncbi:MAG: hypothetical protein HQ582_17215 [Planctomycetes bacterium]|nr:hypothetical protein [Planctomycetota bacterium]
MSSPTHAQTAPAETDLEELRRKHEALYRRVCDENAKLVVEGEERRRAKTEIDSLLEEMRLLAVSAADTAQCDWLSEASVQWQEVFTEVFNIPEDVLEKVGEVSPSRKLRRVPRPMSVSQIEGYLQRSADEVSQSRKLTELYRQLEYLRHHRGSIHAAIPSDWNEMLDDWYQAHVYLANEALSGGVDFARRFEPSTFPYLERVWLDDVKRLQAYRTWYHGSASWDECPERYYLDACEKLRERVLDASAKAPPEAFAKVRKHIRRYLTDDCIQPERNRRAEEIVRIKANRLSLLPGRSGNAADNWREAERYAESYYESIIPAADDGAPTATGAVLEAISNHCELANAFEVAVCIGFLSPEAIRTSGCDLRRLI